MKSRVELGGDELKSMINEAEDAQQNAATGERRRRRRTIRDSASTDDKLLQQNIQVENKETILPDKHLTVAANTSLSQRHKRAATGE